MTFLQKIINSFKPQPSIVTRFAPSPTGFMHIGGLRTALYNFALANNNKGKFILRIEDTDQQRLVENSLVDIIKTLNYFGLHYDEGPVLENDVLTHKGSHGPYIQSQRLSIYQEYANKLVQQKKAYYCFCDSQRLNELHEQQKIKKQPTKYDGLCRHLSQVEIDANLQKKLNYVIRLIIPQNQTIKVYDEIRGELSFDSNLIDDQVLLKSDGFPTYHLAVIIDDHLMGVNHIIRGEEWLPSTPKHVLLYQYLNWTVPKYIHLPLLINKDRSKLSKRSGDVAVRDYINKGYLPAAILNFIALLGWHPGQDLEKLELTEMVKLFSIRQINKSAAIFDLDKLDWFNQQYLQQLSVIDFEQLLRKWLEQWNPNFLKSFNIYSAQAAQTRIKKFADYPELFSHLKELSDYQADLLVFKKSTKEKSLLALTKTQGILNQLTEDQWQESIIKEELNNIIKDNQLTNGDLFWPIRVALSGKEYSESPIELLLSLGSAESIIRLNKAISKLEDNEK